MWKSTSELGYELCGDAVTLLNYLETRLSLLNYVETRLSEIY